MDKVSLIVAGMNKEEVAKLFSETSKKYLQENMPTIAERISIEIRQKLNERLKDISSAKIVKSVRRKNIKNDSPDNENASTE